MTYLTIFTAPKPFANPHINVIQRNAIQSWLNLGPEVEVTLIGEEDGMAEAAAEYGARVLPEVQRNEAGTPLVSSIFSLARQTSQSPFLAYVNADILLTCDIVQATRQVSAALQASSTHKTREAGKDQDFKSPFLLIGQRWDLEVRRFLDFSAGWEERLKADVRSRGQLHPPAGSDYFVFPRDAFNEVPDFAIGRAGWDNWMIYRARQEGWPVVDGTLAVMAIHQNHDYSHLPGGKPHYDLEESQQNISMAGGFSHMYMVLDAQWQIVDGRLHRPPFTPTRIVRSIERWLTPKEGGLRGPRGALARRFRRLRRRLTG